MKKAVFPGSFDPFTKGHEDIVLKGLSLFDEVIVAIGINSTKKYLFDLDQRTAWIKETFATNPRVNVMRFEGLTVEFCKTNGASYILRGLRNPTDFQFESNIAQMNSVLNPSIQTIYMQCSSELSAINSTIVREIYKNGGDISAFIPSAIKMH